MSSSLFQVVCPTCGGRLSIIGAGEAWCSACAQGFLLRMGHLVPVSPSPSSSRPLTGSVVMRIAQIAPLYEAVPPGLYGGTERVIAALCDSLVRAGSRRELVRRRRLDHGG